MAKKICPSCGASVSEDSFFCTHCGAALPQSGAAVQTAPSEESWRVETPRTIEELAAFCERHRLPLAKMRFFIGLDYPGAQAFGIYRDANGEFVVYKNKSDGSRAVRYRGRDEARAVREIFEKLKDEASRQRARVAAARTGASSGGASYDGSESAAGVKKSGKRSSNKLLIGILALATAITVARTAAAVHQHTPRPSAGYYHYNNDYYYSQNDDWYLYDSAAGDWFPIYAVDDELSENYGDYYSSYSFDEDYGVGSFENSEYYSYSDYDEGDSSSSWSWDWDDDDDWDSSSDWDWGSDWDSGSTDWDSDW